MMRVLVMGTLTMLDIALLKSTRGGEPPIGRHLSKGGRSQRVPDRLSPRSEAPQPECFGIQKEITGRTLKPDTDPATRPASAPETDPAEHVPPRSWRSTIIHSPGIPAM
jgi:hypothetical protein